MNPAPDDPRRARVGVVGGGLAGIAAALRCADAGHPVILWETRARLGGLAGSFRRGAMEVDTGQHVFLRCCAAYRALLARLHAEHLVTLQDRLDIPVLSPGRAPARLRRQGGVRRPTLPAPLHLAGALGRYRLVPWRERVSLARTALALRGIDPTDPAVDARSFGEWLAEHGQGPRAVEALWDLIGVATLNAPADRASLALAATVFRLGLLTDAGAADIGTAAVPLGRLHDTAARTALARAGVEVRTGARVTAVVPGGPGTWRVEVRDRDGAVTRTDTGAVVCALPPAAAARVLPEPLAGVIAARADGLGHAPILDLHVVYDRPVLDEPFAAGVDTPVPWVFDRTAASGAVAVHGTGAQYLVVSLSAADARIGVPSATLRAELLPALARLLPRAAGARVLDAFVTREPHATFRPAPGSAALRPGPDTGAPGLALAGAWTATGWPATMEGAVRSGTAAAAVVLGHLAGRAPGGAVAA